MSIRTSLIALASVAALVGTALVPTSASAFWAGHVQFRAFVGHFHYGYLYPQRLPGLPFIPGCGHIGCNMKW
jgi:hypothetical protein